MTPGEVLRFYLEHQMNPPDDTLWSVLKELEQLQQLKRKVQRERKEQFARRARRSNAVVYRGLRDNA